MAKTWMPSRVDVEIRSMAAAGSNRLIVAGIRQRDSRTRSLYVALIDANTMALIWEHTETRVDPGTSPVEVAAFEDVGGSGAYVVGATRGEATIYLGHCRYTTFGVTSCNGAYLTKGNSNARSLLRSISVHRNKRLVIFGGVTDGVDLSVQPPLTGINGFFAAIDFGKLLS